MTSKTPHDTGYKLHFSHPEMVRDLFDIDDILKESTMLEQTIERWFEDATMKGVRQGKQEGMQQGMQQGLQQGFARAVALQLQLRFGPVPAWVQERLDVASEEQLTQWLGAILTAKSMPDLFDTGGSIH